MRKLISTLVVLSFAVLACADVVIGSYRRAMPEVCALIESHFYKSDDEFVREWLEYCNERANAQDFLVSKDRTIFEINSLLSQLAVSHLFLYTPQESKAIWDNEAVDTGIRALNIDGDIIVTEVLPGSVAKKSGIKVGDQILLINDQEVGQISNVTWTSGYFTVVRARDRFSISIIPETLFIDLAPTTTYLTKSTLHLRIQSFLPQYFDDGNWREIAKKVSSAERVILDLRGNAGGSFPAMLRVASSFICDEQIIGSLEISYGRSARFQDKMKNDLSAETQLKQVQSVSRLNLKTFSGYPCFKGPLTVLVDSTTASTAEILAHALKDLLRARVWGTDTAGEVVMARWFPVRSLGSGFSISIPIAGYRTSRGLELEDQGLSPDLVLRYRRADAILGRDSWLLDSVSK